MQACDQLLCGAARAAAQQAKAAAHKACAVTRQSCTATHKPMPQRRLPTGLELFLGHIHGDFHIVNEFANEFVVVLVVQVF